MTGTVLIAGAGLAGARCAETLRAHGFEGRIVLAGDEPLGPYERPALSKEVLLGERGDVLLRPAGYWEERGIELLTATRVEQVDAARRTATVGGRELSWSALVVATGARPRRLPGPPGVHYLRSLADALALRAELRPGRRLVVVGSGFVGAEAATAAARLGMHVTVVEAALSPLAGLLGDEVGETLSRRYAEQGIELLLGARVERVEPGAVALPDRRLPFDALLVGIGVEPARELVPDTPHPDVLLAGDVTGSGHWTAAFEQGAAAALRLLRLDVPAPQPSYVWSDQLGLRLQLVGDPRPAANVELDGAEGGFHARYLDRDGRLVGALAVNRPAAVAAFRRELAALPSAA